MRRDEPLVRLDDLSRLRKCRRGDMGGSQSGAKRLFALECTLVHDAGGRRRGERGRDRTGNQRDGKSQEQAHPGLPGGHRSCASTSSKECLSTSPSRGLPPAPGDTRPSASIMSTSRAARLKPIRSRRWRYEIEAWPLWTMMRDASSYRSSLSISIPSTVFSSVVIVSS